MTFRSNYHLSPSQYDAIKQIKDINRFYKEHIQTLKALYWWELDNPETGKPFAACLEAESFRQTLIDLWTHRRDLLISHFAAILPDGLIEDEPRAGSDVHSIARATKGSEFLREEQEDLADLEWSKRNDPRESDEPIEEYLLSIGTKADVP